MKSKSQVKLRNVLRGNGLFSGLSGLALALFSQEIGQWMGVVWVDVLLYIGLGLIIFSISLFLTASAKTISKRKVQSIIIQDGVWVVGSAIILIFQLFDLSNIGYWLVADVAIIVGAFATLQWRYM